MRLVRISGANCDAFFQLNVCLWLLLFDPFGFGQQTAPAGSSAAGDKTGADNSSIDHVARDLAADQGPRSGVLQVERNGGLQWLAFDME